MKKNMRYYFNRLLPVALVFAVGLAAGCGGEERREEGPPTDEYEKYCTYAPGNCPLVISVPHGGLVVPSECAIRTTANTSTTDFSTAYDTNTIELSEAFMQKFFERTGKRPYIIVCQARRTVVDQNRRVDIAVPHDDNGYYPANKYIYDSYHAYVRQARTAVLTAHGKGLLLDFHGHGHEKQRVEIGYSLSRDNLSSSNAAINNPLSGCLDKFSVRKVAIDNEKTVSDMLFGPKSFGEFLYKGGAATGLNCIPRTDSRSPELKEDGQNYEPYFNGGYITTTYGSSVNSIDAGATSFSSIQLEFHSTARNSTTNRNKAADALVDAVVGYMNEFYGNPFPSL